MATRSILVVEDDAAIRNTLTALLDFKGYRWEEAANGQEALDQLAKVSRPCLILLDLMMPVMSGWEFLEKIAQDSSLAQIPIVVVSAYSEKAKDLPVKAVLKKPIDLRLLTQVIEQYCGGAPSLQASSSSDPSPGKD